METGTGSVWCIINHSFIVANYFKALTHGQRGTRNDDEKEDEEEDDDDDDNDNDEDGSSSKVLSSSVGSSVNLDKWHLALAGHAACLARLLVHAALPRFTLD